MTVLGFVQVCGVAILLGAVIGIIVGALSICSAYLDGRGWP